MRRTIVIGSSREQKLPSLVLEHTILKYTSLPVRIVHTWDKTFPVPKNPKNRSRTGFSFARFAIPELVGYEGKAAYLECDQIVFRDVKALFGIPFNEAVILRPPNQPSVLLLDCDHLRWDVRQIIKGLDEGHYSYHALMECLCIEPAFKIAQTIPNEWNSLERYISGETALLHYTNMATQPWRRWGHPLANLWLDALLDGVRSGRIRKEEVFEDVQLKHVIPQVGEWLRSKIKK